MKTLSRAAILCSVILASLAAAEAPNPAVARTEALIATFKALPAGASKGSEKAYRGLDAFIDTDAIVADAIGPRAAKFKPTELAEFKRLFRELIRGSGYPKAGNFFRTAKLTLGTPKVAGAVTQVPIKATVPSEDLNTSVALHWAETPQGLRIVDVSFDGDSLLKDYQNQFARIVDKDGAGAALAKLRDRKAKLEGSAPKKAVAK